jgi:hypothetical protein
MTTQTIGGVCTLWVLTVMIFAAGPAWSQEKVGVVTTVIGPVTVARASNPAEPLKFKDGVFVSDRVTTGDGAFTRILLGGKAIITARERSTLTITESPGLSTIHLTNGRIAVAVEKSRMQPGERVDVRTPNAVAGVRGTVLIVEAEPDSSTVTVLRGLVHVTRLDSVTGAPIGGFTAVGAREAVTVRNDTLPPRARAVAARRAEELSYEFTPPLKMMTSVPVAVPEELLRDAISQIVLGKTDAPAGEREAVGGDSLDPSASSASAVTASTTLVTGPTSLLSTTPVVAAPIKLNTPNYGASLLHTSPSIREPSGGLETKRTIKK